MRTQSRTSPRADNIILCDLNIHMVDVSGYLIEEISQERYIHDTNSGPPENVCIAL